VEPTSTIELSDGRRLAFDDVGDPEGAPVLYLHGTPDCRLARHPDDRAAARAQVRLLAVDRAGWGRSDPLPRAGLRDVGRDLVEMVDRLELPRVSLLGWSAGGLAALSAAAQLGERASRAVLVGAVPPVEAYADVGVVAALGPSRRAFAELALELPPRELAEEVAPYLLPDPLDLATAIEHVLEGAGERGRAELASVPGALERLAEATIAAVEQGRDQLVEDIVLQLEPGLDLGTVAAPVTTFHGDHDHVSPPPVGRWLAARLPTAEVVVVDEAAHHLLMPMWEHLLRAAAAPRDGFQTA